MADPKWLGARVRELREQAGLTQQQLADSVGCTWEAVSRWERGTREPGWSQVLALCKALGVDCTVFAQQPAEVAEKPEPGRPRKASAAEQAATRGPDQGEPSGEKPATRKGKRKDG